MSITTQTELDQIAADIQEIIDDNPTMITIRRGTETLAPQKVRLERPGTSGSNNRSGQAAEENRSRITILGNKSLNIRKDDRFNDALGNFFQVSLVRINQQVCIQAEGELVQ